ncbi:hypothetical protein [Rhizobium sp. 11_C7_N12_5]|uniref:hypothetical protein n=1 Tax=Rhizobium sp. 11_C7_N12_5 TaxID=3240770 RepID=UPI003F2248AA
MTNLDNYVEFERQRIFERKEHDSIYDWQADWLNARHLHDFNSDFVRNRRVHADDVKLLWREWHEQTRKHMGDLSLEALRSMVLLNGAAVLASLAVLTGQITAPTHGARIAASCTILFSIASIIMLALGHLLQFMRTNVIQAEIRGVLVGHVKHSKLYAIGRYTRRFLDPIVNIGNILIYSSIFAFAFGSALAAIVLIST